MPLSAYISRTTMGGRGGLFFLTVTYFIVLFLVADEASTE